MGLHVGVLRLPRDFDRVAIEEFAELLHEVSTRAVVVVRADARLGRDANHPPSDPALSPMMGRVLSRLLSLERPTIALVDRASQGLVVGVVAACDVVLATTRASFSLRAPGVDKIPSHVWPILAARVPSKTLASWVANDVVNVDTALEGGLVDVRCHPEAADETLRAEVRTLCSVATLYSANIGVGLVEASTLERPSARRRRGWRR